MAGGYWLGRSGLTTAAAGFMGVGLGWVLAAAVPWVLTGSALPGRVATLLGMPGGGGMGLVVLAGVASGLVGALATVTGWWMRATRGRGTFESAHSTPRN